MKTIQNFIVLGLVALLVVSLAGCGGGGIQASWTKTGKDGTTHKQEVTIGATDEKKEEPKKDSAKTMKELLGELEVAVATANAKMAALRALGFGKPLVVQKEEKDGGELALSPEAKRLLNDKSENGEQPKEATEADPKAPSTEKKRETKTCSK